MKKALAILIICVASWSCVQHKQVTSVADCRKLQTPENYQLLAFLFKQAMKDINPNYDPNAKVTYFVELADGCDPSDELLNYFREGNIQLKKASEAIQYTHYIDMGGEYGRTPFAYDYRDRKSGKRCTKIFLNISGFNDDGSINATYGWDAGSMALHLCEVEVQRVNEGYVIKKVRMGLRS
jgi:hypothetical protein